jgi:hypothetical protein
MFDRTKMRPFPADLILACQQPQLRKCWDMLTLRRWILIFLGGWLFADGLRGQQVPLWLAAEGIPPAPAERLIDRAGLFTRHPEAARRITAMLGELEANHGFKLYLVVESVMISGTPPELAAQLQQGWLPEADGFVIVYEMTSHSIGIGRGMEGETDLGLEGRVPSHEMVRLLYGLAGENPADQSPEAYLESLTSTLVAALDDYFTRRKAPGNPGRNLRLGMIGAGILAILALVAMAVIWLMRRSEEETSRVYHFPEVDLPERLGAPAGGGAVTARRFDEAGHR